MAEGRRSDLTLRRIVKGPTAEENAACVFQSGRIGIRYFIRLNSGWAIDEELRSTAPLLLFPPHL